MYAKYGEFHILVFIFWEQTLHWYHYYINSPCESTTQASRQIFSVTVLHHSWTNSICFSRKKNCVDSDWPCTGQYILIFLNIRPSRWFPMYDIPLYLWFLEARTQLWNYIPFRWIAKVSYWSSVPVLFFASLFSIFNLISTVLFHC